MEMKVIQLRWLLERWSAQNQYRKINSHTLKESEYVAVLPVLYKETMEIAILHVFQYH